MTSPATTMKPRTNRYALTQEAAKATGRPAATCGVVLNSMFDIMADFLAHGHTIEIREHFTMHPVTRKGKVAQNPRARLPVYVPEHLTVKATFSPELKKSIALGMQKTA
jgi:nucleoid DNA-binding protein